MRLRAGSGTNLWEEVRRQKPGLPSYCGGKGRCGKCRIRVISGEASIGREDRQHLSEEEIKAGWRIACQSRALSDCVIEAAEAGEETMQVLSVGTEGHGAGIGRPGSCSVAIDIGTTTLAFALLDEAGTVISAETGLNHQRSFGTDVVSRIEQAVQGQREELTACIRRDVREGIYRLLEHKQMPLSFVRHIAVAGNTTMEQLFFGFPMEGLACYPFEAHTYDFIETEYGELFGEAEEWEKGNGGILVTGFPCMAGFVGGDITAGLYELESQEKAANHNYLLLDIGTNGELVCVCGDRILVTSTAAGPVFEGGSISCGMGSLPGAVCATDICGDALVCKVSGEAAAEGICGSGLIEAVADLLKLRVINQDGLLLPAFQERGYLLTRGRAGKQITLTQADIREFQMAKAAIAAGTELLCCHSGLEMEEISRFYLAGGLGNGLDVKKAVKTGLLPQSALRRALAAGNTSLKGAIRLLREGETGKAEVKKIQSRAEHIHLANTENFQQVYLAHMNF